MCSKEYLISIIVPIYNSETTLERCLKSLVNQTYKDLEIILVNDGSTDNSLELCELYAQKDNRVKVYSKDNGGLSSARNYGIQNCSGRYIGFVDSDDYIELDMYESMMSCMLEHDADIVVQPFIFHIGRKEPIFADTDDYYVMNRDEAMKAMLKGEIFAGHVCNKLFKRTVISYAIFREDIYLYEDMIAMWNVLSLCNKLVWENKHSYHYVMNEGSLMHAKYNEKCLTGRTAAEEIVSDAKKHYMELIPYAEVFLLRVNWDICKRAWRLDYLERKIRLREYNTFRNTLKSIQPKAFDLLTTKERKWIKFVSRNLLFLSTYIKLKKFYTKIRVIVKKIKV